MGKTLEVRPQASWQKPGKEHTFYNLHSLHIQLLSHDSHDSVPALQDTGISLARKRSQATRGGAVRRSQARVLYGRVCAAS